MRKPEPTIKAGKGIDPKQKEFKCLIVPSLILALMFSMNMRSPTSSLLMQSFI